MLQAACDRWWTLLVRGIFAVLMGLFAILWPQWMLLAIVILFAAFAVADGVVAILLGMGGKSDGRVLWGLIGLGVLAILAGIGAMMSPTTVLIVFVAIAGATAILRGILEIVAAVRLRKAIEGEWLLALSGLFSIGFGALMFVCPILTAKVFAVVIGIYMLILGATAIALALRLRALGARLSSGA